MEDLRCYYMTKKYLVADRIQISINYLKSHILEILLFFKKSKCLKIRKKMHSV